MSSTPNSTPSLLQTILSLFKGSGYCIDWKSVKLSDRQDTCRLASVDFEPFGNRRLSMEFATWYIRSYGTEHSSPSSPNGTDLILSVGTQSSGEEAPGRRYIAVKGYTLCTKVERVRHASSSALVPCANQPRCGPSRSSLLASEASGGDGTVPVPRFFRTTESYRLAKGCAGQSRGD